MARTWSRIVGPAQIATGPVTIYTVPAGTKAIVRHIHIYNPSTALTVTVSIGADAAGTRILDALPVAEDVPFDHFGIYTLAAAEVIQAASSVNNQAVITIDAELVTL